MSRPVKERAIRIVFHSENGQIYAKYKLPVLFCQAPFHPPRWLQKRKQIKEILPNRKKNEMCLLKKAFSKQCINKKAQQFN